MCNARSNQRVRYEAIMLFLTQCRYRLHFDLGFGAYTYPVLAAFF